MASESANDDYPNKQLASQSDMDRFPSSDAAASHSAFASRALAIADSIVSPQVMHPGRSG